MLYDYYCPHCPRSVTIEKSLTEIERIERCPGCREAMARKISRSHIAKSSLSRTGDGSPYFDPILGEVVKSAKHAEAVAKTKGLVCVGDDYAGLNALTPKNIEYNLTDAEYHDVMSLGEVH